MVRALIFDMDGVVVDSNGVHRDAWIEFNARHGIQTTEEMLGRMYGKRNDEIIRDFFGDQLSDSEIFSRGAEKEALYRQRIEPTLKRSLVPGIREFLKSHRHLELAMATNAEEANAEFILKGTGLRPLFRFVVDGHQVTHPKPHPEIYLRSAELLGIPPRECVVFEDSYAGVTAGLAAGMSVIGIQTTHSDLPGTSLQVRDFRDAAIDSWLARF